MNILTIGDVVSPLGVKHLSDNLWRIRRENNIGFTVVNGENASVGNGLDRESALVILEAGADVITGGNHIFRKHSLYSELENGERVIRPANYPAAAPGCGYTLLDANGYRVLVINVMGVVYLEPLACPFDTIERILVREEGRYDISLLDIHAEATSEKMALGRYFDGRISAVFGTHTHVQTADEQVLVGGTGFITDIGYTGPHDSVLGVKSDIIITKLRTHLPQRFDYAEGDVYATGAIFDIDETSGKCRSVRRIRF